MNIKECYACIGANWQEVYERFGGNEAIVKKFAIKFLEDPSFHDMKAAVAEGDTDRAFRAAHTLKGVCLNLGFSKLCDLSSQLTEILRGRELKGYEAVLSEVEKQYQITVEAIRELGQ